MKAVAGIIATIASVALSVKADPLGPYNVDKSSITVGGLSAGAFMAVQLHVAYSDIFQGAAVFAGGPFYCSQGQLTTAVTTCMDPILTKPNPQALADETVLAAIGGRVAAVSNMSDDQVFVYSGLLDSVVTQAVVQSTAAYYNYFVNTSTGGNVTTQFDVWSEHCYPTNGTFGEQCSQLGSPFIGQCAYDGAGAALHALLSPSRMGGLNAPRGSAVSSNLMQFDQIPFGGGFNSLDTTGYIYVPTACQNNSARCRLHVSLHGCEQTQADIGNDFAMYVGLNEWAETNNIIVLYPYVARSDLIPENPEGCFDWWGYAGADFAFRTGVQMQFVVNIINTIVGGGLVAQ